MHNKVLMVIVLFFFLTSCKNQKVLATNETFAEYCESLNQDYRYEIEDIYEGKFTNSSNRNLLVFFKTYSKGKEIIESKETHLFEINKFNKIVKSYYVPYYKFSNPDTKLIKEIDQISDNDITKYDNTIITDFNKNGKQEILFFEMLGTAYEFNIIEFKDKKFTCVFTLSNYYIEHIDFNNSIIYTYSPKYNQKLIIEWKGKPFNSYYYRRYGD